MDGETWRPVVGHVGYEVSDRGRVRSFMRGPTRILKPRAKKDGRLHVLLHGENCMLHRLVLDAFIGPMQPGFESFHIDDDHTNNCVSNLRWATHAENCAHKIVTGKNGSAKGEANGRAKLTYELVARLRVEAEQGVTIARLSERYGISDTQTRRLVAGEGWEGYRNGR